MCNKTHSGLATDVTIFKIVSPKDLAKKCLPRKAAFWVKLVNYSFAKTVLQILTLAPWISAILFLCTYVCTHAFGTRWIGQLDNWNKKNYDQQIIWSRCYESVSAENYGQSHKSVKYKFVCISLLGFLVPRNPIIVHLTPALRGQSCGVRLIFYTFNIFWHFQQLGFGHRYYSSTMCLSRYRWKLSC
jgi:hypothetical protein